MNFRHSRTACEFGIRHSHQSADCASDDINAKVYATNCMGLFGAVKEADLKNIIMYSERLTAKVIEILSLVNVNVPRLSATMSLAESLLLELVGHNPDVAFALRYWSNRASIR